MIAQTDVLALLEDGSHTTTELAAWCDVTVAEMTRRLAQLQNEGLVARHHSQSRWCRRTRPMRRVDVEVSTAAVLAQLEFAPKAVVEIARVLDAPRPAIERALDQLAAALQVKVVGRGSSARWALASWKSDQAISTAHHARSSKRHGQRADERPAPDIAFGVRPVMPDQYTAIPPKPKPTPVTADGVSWWVPGAAPEAPRTVFTRAAQARDDEMANDPKWRKPASVTQLGWLGPLDER